MLILSRVACVEYEKLSTMLAAGTPTAPAICKCAPVSRQMPFSDALVIDAQVGCAFLIVR